MRKLKVFICFVIFFSCFNNVFVYASDVKIEVNSFINDSSDMFTYEEECNIATMLYNLEKQTSIKFVIMTIDILESKTIETYAKTELDKIVTDNKNNVMLLLISLKDREFRLEISDGLNNVISNYNAKLIIDELVEPFRRESYAEGVEKCLDSSFYYLNKKGGYDINIKNSYNFSYKDELKNKNSFLFILIGLGVTFIIILKILPKKYVKILEDLDCDCDSDDFSSDSGGASGSW